MLIKDYIEIMLLSYENICIWLLSCLYVDNVIVFTTINDCGRVYDYFWKPKIEPCEISCFKVYNY